MLTYCIYATYMYIINKKTTHFMIIDNFIQQHFIQIYTILDMSFYDLKKKLFHLFVSINLFSSL